MDDYTLEILYNIAKNERFICDSNVRVRKNVFDGSKESFCFVYPRKKLGESYTVENYSKQSFLVYRLCEEGCSVEEIVNNMTNMKNSPGKLKVFEYVIHTIRDFQKKGILYEKNN